MGQTTVGYDAEGNPVTQGFFGGSKTAYAVDPTTYGQSFTDINPYSSQAGANLFGSNVNNYISSALSTDPNAAFNQFTSTQFNELADLVSGSQSALQQSLTDRASQLSTQATNQVASQYAGQNALFGSGFASDVGTAAAQPFADVANTLGTQQINLLGNLANTQMGLTNQNYLAAQQNALGLLGLQGSFGEQTFVSPDLVTSAGGTGTNILSGVAGSVAGGIGTGLGLGLGSIVGGLF